MSIHNFKFLKAQPIAQFGDGKKLKEAASSDGRIHPVMSDGTEAVYTEDATSSMITVADLVTIVKK